MHYPTDRIIHTTAFVTPVVEHMLEREIAQWVHHEGSIHKTSALLKHFLPSFSFFSFIFTLPLFLKKNSLFFFFRVKTIYFYLSFI